MNNAFNQSILRPVLRPMRHASRLLGAVLLCASALTHAQTQPLVSVGDAWLRATVPQQKVTGAFMQLTATQDARLVEVRSSIAGRAELHQMSMSDNVMKMRHIDALDLPAGKAVALTPGGYHVMLFDLKAPVQAGDKIPLTLIVEGKNKERKEIEVTAVARGLNGAPAHAMP